MTGRSRTGLLTGTALLVPAFLAAVSALSLLRFSWPVAAARDEPILALLLGDRELESALTEASAAVPFDADSSRELGERARDAGRRGGWSPEHVEEAWRLTLEAARRAPTDAETRFHLSGLAWRRGDEETADRQARAAFRLAPLYRDLRARVAEYFLSRFRATRDVRHLTTAIRAYGANGETTSASLLSDPRVTREEVGAAFAAARVSPERQVAYLGEAGRWEWAIHFALEADRAAGSGHGREAAVRSRLAGYLLSTSRREPAFRQVLRARGLDAKAVKDELLLARAFLFEGHAGLALGAIQRSLDGTGSVREIEEALVADGVDPKVRRSLWREVVGSGRGGDRARLAEGRAAAADRDLASAHRLLGELVDRPDVGAEACFSLARAHRELGDRRVALRYARRASQRDPENRSYTSLLRELEGGGNR